MDTNQIVTIATGILEGGGLAAFIYFLVRGLRSKISALEGTIDAQKKTLDVMDKRIAETEKVGEIYRKLLTDLPTDIENYRKIVSSTKDDMIQELQKAVQIKDDQLKESAQLKLKEIELVEQSLSAIPKLQNELVQTIQQLQKRVKSIDLLDPIHAWSSSFRHSFLLRWPRDEFSCNWALLQYLSAIGEAGPKKPSQAVTLQEGTEQSKGADPPTPDSSKPSSA